MGIDYNFVIRNMLLIFFAAFTGCVLASAIVTLCGLVLSLFGLLHFNDVPSFWILLGAVTFGYVFGAKVVGFSK